jgi:hypothetical protein
MRFRRKIERNIIDPLSVFSLESTSGSVTRSFDSASRISICHLSPILCSIAHSNSINHPSPDRSTTGGCSENSVARGPVSASEPFSEIYRAGVFAPAPIGDVTLSAGLSEETDFRSDNHQPEYSQDCRECRKAEGKPQPEETMIRSR